MNGKRCVLLGMTAILGMTATACSGSSEETEEAEKAAVDVVTPREARCPQILFIWGRLLRSSRSM